MVVNFVGMYEETFPSEPDLARFVDCVEHSIIDPEESNNYSKVALHQACRMVQIADILEEQLKGHPALQIFFYLIAAEAVAKLYFDFEGRGESRAHVVKFFGEICEEQVRERLRTAFYSNREERPLSWEEAVGFLYDIRNDVAHRGRYYNVTLALQTPVQWFVPSPEGSQLNGPVGVNVEVHELRQMILRGAATACKNMLPRGVDC